MRQLQFLNEIFDVIGETNITETDTYFLYLVRPSTKIIDYDF